MKTRYTSLRRWTPTVRTHVLTVAQDMADMDGQEIFGLRPAWHTGENIVEDIGRIIGSCGLIDGFVAFTDTEDESPVPVAVALAFKDTMPHVANLAMFGRKGYARAMPSIYEELFSRSISFGPQFNIKMAQVPVLANHKAARRWMRSLGGQEAFDYGPIGPNGAHYIHTIWRF